MTGVLLKLVEYFINEYEMIAGHNSHETFIKLITNLFWSLTVDLHQIDVNRFVQDQYGL